MFPKLMTLFVSCVWSINASALVFQLPRNGDSVIGRVQYTSANSGDNFSTIGRRFNTGYYQLVEANPGVNPQSPGGSEIIVPTKYILPQAPRTGIVINVAELRLYYYPPGGRQVMTFPLGIGREGWNTPVGATRIVAKDRNPTWIPPKSIRDFRRSEGVHLPPVVPPGPDNPLGGYRMRLGFNSGGTFLIHATNDPSGIGRRSSSGCIRMLPEDAAILFSHVSIGTPVRVVNEPYKVGWLNGKMYLESHVPLGEQMWIYRNSFVPLERTIMAASRGRDARVNWQTAREVARDESGIPEEIGDV